jgi:methylmalonyl-CoA mutase
MSAEVQGKKSTPLFGEFEPTTKDRWLAIVAEDLKGVDFDKKLVWKPYEGFSVQPMYFRRDTEKLEHLRTLPGFAPFLRSSRILGNSDTPWTIAQTHHLGDINELRGEIQQGSRGGERRAGILFHKDLRSASGISLSNDPASQKGAWLPHLDAMKSVCEGIENTPGLDLYAGLSSPVFLAMSVAANTRTLHVEFDPLADLVKEGTLPWSASTAFRLMGDAVRFANENAVDTSVVAVNSEVYHNAGASAVQELACALATGVEYLHQLQDRGLTVDEVASRMRFSFPVGSTFFMEVAKLRAARLLWARIVEAFEPGNEAAARMHMHVRTSRWSKTAYDPYVNMLRATVESMAGAIGGAEVVDTAAFDEVTGSSTPLSRRIARNTQIILQEEAQISQVIDPAGGSYYVEHLTDAVARHAWEMLQEIERSGGMLKALEEGFIQSAINETAERKKENISRRKDVIVGTNQYPNLTEKPVNVQNGGETPGNNRDVELRAYIERRGDVSLQLGKVSAAMEDESRNLVSVFHGALVDRVTVPEINQVLLSAAQERLHVRPLPQFRAAERFEELRRSVESAEKKPLAFLATYGPVFWRRARATFASGFLGAAGLDIIDNIGFSSAAEAGEAAVHHGADILVACSEDENYRETIPEVMNVLKKAGSRMLVIVAGNPEDDAQALLKVGVHTFIHVKSDVGKALADILQTLGIEIH